MLGLSRGGVSIALLYPWNTILDDPWILPVASVAAYDLFGPIIRRRGQRGCFAYCPCSVIVALLVRNMSQESSSVTTAESAASGSRSTSSTPPAQQQAPGQRRVPIFQPIDADDARARAAVEQWRTFTMLLEPQVRRLQGRDAVVDINTET